MGYVGTHPRRQADQVVERWFSSLPELYEGHQVGHSTCWDVRQGARVSPLPMIVGGWSSVVVDDPSQDSIM